MNDKNQKNIKGTPRKPFKVAQDWDHRMFYILATKDDRVRVRVEPSVEGDWKVSLECLGWASPEDAQDIVGLMLGPIIDEHGYCRDMDECEWQAYEELAGSPRVVSIGDDLIAMSQDDAKALVERPEEGGEETSNASGDKPAKKSKKSTKSKSKRTSKKKS